ncbi:adenosylcobinamide-phosphate synthase [Rhodoligotrophos appendicifer]|uniref:adenosylcobinamide-phosphate synthase CbiB n=1 Tax=Rhodoligotrophos appendicifer TaxID=987056 RepID=UPI0011866EBF|nr:adenosylcobinamide-phosphate synthase CbiB [Rhodoligotrophos appendicifer]
MVWWLILAVSALLIEAAVGYPASVYKRLSHPVVWIGKLIASLDASLNREALGSTQRRFAGIAATALTIFIFVVPAVILQVLAVQYLPPIVALALLAIICSTLFAQRSLHEHVEAVATALDRQGLSAARQAVSSIVGRDPQKLDEAGVARAAIESLAENFSDGVVAPAFWCACFGLPGVVFYKSINTADSMVGHKSPKYADFGWCSARLDDLINLPASRLSVIWILLASFMLEGADPTSAWTAVRRDASRHRSPNAGWPEAAFAGALGLQLNGPKTYGASVTDDAWMGAGRSAASASDIRRALKLYRLACSVQILGLAAILLVLMGLTWQA